MDQFEPRVTESGAVRITESGATRLTTEPLSTVVVEASATSFGSSVVIGNSGLTRSSSGAAQGLATVSGVGARIVRSLGNVAGTSSVSGAGIAWARAVFATAAIAVVIGQSAATQRATATSTGTATVAGQGRAEARALAGSTGSATVSGSSSFGLSQGALGTAAGTSTVLGSLGADARSAAQAAGLSTVAGSVTAIRDAIAQASGVSAITGSGASNKYTPDKAFENNEPGVWFDPSEPANMDWRRNLLTWSEDWSNPAWSKTNVSISGQNIVETATTGQHVIFRASSDVTSAVVTIDAKANGRDWMVVSLRNATGARASYFNLSTGAFSVASGFTASMEDIGDGIWQCRIVTDATVVNASGFQIGPTIGSGIASYDGDGVSGITVFRAQYEPGPAATPYQRITDVSAELRELFPNATMFTDNTGLTPVVLGQAVGLWLDKSKGLVLGSELATNGDFSGGATGWTLGSGWSVSGGEAVRADTGVEGLLSQNMGLVLGRTYLISFNITVASAGFEIRLGSNTSGARVFLVPGSGAFSIIVTATSSNGIFYIRGSTTSAGTIDNISVRELPGNHASQATAARRPFLRQETSGKYYLEFDGVDDSLQTAAFNPNTNQAQVFVGVRQNSTGTATGQIFETSNDLLNNNGVIGLAWPAQSDPNILRFQSRGTVFSGVNDATAVPPNTSFISMQTDIGAPSIIGRRNGEQVAFSSGNQGSGNYLSHPLNIGSRGNASLRFNGRLYGMVLRFGPNLDAAQVGSLEDWTEGQIRLIRFAEGSAEGSSSTAFITPILVVVDANANTEGSASSVVTAGITITGTGAAAGSSSVVGVGSRIVQASGSISGSTSSSYKAAVISRSTGVVLASAGTLAVPDFKIALAASGEVSGKGSLTGSGFSIRTVSAQAFSAGSTNGFSRWTHASRGSVSGLASLGIISGTFAKSRGTVSGAKSNVDAQITKDIFGLGRSAGSSKHQLITNGIAFVMLTIPSRWDEPEVRAHWKNLELTAQWTDPVIAGRWREE
jgi:hypothetical protein